MKTVALKLPEALLAKIDSTARQRGETRSALMRQALEDLVTEQGTGDAVSCLELARDLSGCVQGPGTLSASPKQMKGYGE